MDSPSDHSSAAILAKQSDPTNPHSPSSRPSSTSSQASKRDTVDSDYSNDASGSSALTTASPAQDYYLPNHKDTSKLESNSSNEIYADKKPTKLASYQGIMESDHSSDSDSLNDSDYSNNTPGSSESEVEPAGLEVYLHDPSYLESYRVVIEEDHSNDKFRTSEPGVEDPAQRYSLPHDEDISKPESNIANQGFAVDKPIPASTAPNPALLDREDSVKDKPEVSNQQYAGRVPHPESTMQEYPYTRRPESFGQRSERPTTAADGADNPPAKRPRLNGYSGHGSSQNSSTQNSNASAGGSSSFNGQGRARSKAKNCTGATFPNGQNPRQNAPSTTSKTSSHQRTGFPPSRMPPVRPAGVPWPQSDQEMEIPSIREPSKPSAPEWVDYVQGNPQSSRPMCLLPNAFESRRLEVQGEGGQPGRLIQGPTQLRGPLLKPFDGPEANKIADKQWMGVMRKNCREAEND